MQLTLDRFLNAHGTGYETALEELRSGRKESHWIWFLFPQIRGLGRSVTAQYFEIQSRQEARDYWAHPVLSAHLATLCRALLELDDPIGQILGYPDDLKLRSCMTLFSEVTGDALFRQVLDKFYNGQPDPLTLEILSKMQP